MALKKPGTDQYTFWNVDSSGNFVSNTVGVVSGSSATLMSLEAKFHQDFNGDGVIGVPAGHPVVLDLDDNGINLVQSTLSSAYYDMDGQSGKEHTAWTSSGDALLAIDLGANGGARPDGVIDQTKEIVFTAWAPGVTSDMAALRLVFDTNHNGELDPGDGRWSEFRVWQDANGDGTSQAGEVRTLDQVGIKSIGLEPIGPAHVLSDGSSISGLSNFVWNDGHVGIAGDVSLAYQRTPASFTFVDSFGGDSFVPPEPSAAVSDLWGLKPGGSTFHHDAVTEMEWDKDHLNSAPNPPIAPNDWHLIG